MLRFRDIAPDEPCGRHARLPAGLSPTVARGCPRLGSLMAALSDNVTSAGTVVTVFSVLCGGFCAFLLLPWTGSSCFAFKRGPPFRFFRAFAILAGFQESRLPSRSARTRERTERQ